MTNQINRRSWIKTGLAGAGMISLTPSFANILYDENDEVVRLSHNENPYGPSPAARDAIIQSIQKGNRYPRASISKLKEVIAAKEGCSADNILITAGSTEILGLMGIIHGIQGGNIISGTPTFDYLMSYSTNFGSEWVRIPLDRVMYPMKQIAEAINEKTELVFICNPNNPIGTYIQNEEIEADVLAMAKKTNVFIDEAYIEFTDLGIKNYFAPIAFKNPNVVVGRTFSKIYGMAGLRVGYALAHKDTIQTMMKYFMGRMVTPSVTSVEAATASIQDEAFARKSKKLNQEAKELVYNHFDQWGVQHWKSHTNFIWFKTDQFNTDVRAGLEQSNVFIRDYDHSPGFARVSVGTMEEMERFVTGAKKLLT